MIFRLKNKSKIINLRSKSILFVKPYIEQMSKQSFQFCFGGQVQGKKDKNIKSST